MRKVEIQFRPTELPIGGIPQLVQAPEVIRESAVFYHEGRTVGVYVDLNAMPWLEQLREIALRSPIAKTTRTGGLPTQSAVYGYLPRVPLRNNFCRLSAVSRNLPKFFHGVSECAKFIEEIYAEHLPEAFEFNRRLAEEKFSPDYKLGSSLFTTCNFNLNYSIPYHRDSGNLRDVFSNVLILRKGLRGGELVFPEWGVSLAQEDGWLGIFDGQRYLHGCTPSHKTHPSGYRCSTVFYALESMKNCLPQQEELRHARTYRDKVESRFREGQ